jgi:hypothetical protein
MKEKILGIGAVATVYKIKINNIYYAKRIEKVFESDVSDILNEKNIKDFDLTNTYNRDIYVMKIFNKINKNHFPKLHKYKIIKNCKHIQELQNYVKKI